MDSVVNAGMRMKIDSFTYVYWTHYHIYCIEVKQKNCKIKSVASLKGLIKVMND